MSDDSTAELPRVFVMGWYRWLITGSWLAFAAISLTMGMDPDAEQPDAWIGAGALAACSLFLAFVTRRTAQVDVTENGVRIHRMFRRRDLAWADIESVHVDRASSLTSSRWRAPCFVLRSGEHVTAHEYRSKQPELDLVEVVDVVSAQLQDRQASA